MPSRKLFGAAAVAASVVGGGVAGALIGTPVLSSAQETDSSTTTTAPEDQNSEEDRPSRPGFGFGHHGPGFGHLDAAAATLGITEDELGDALADGQTLAEIAAANDVEVQAIVDALVADATASIDEAVADEDLDADRGAELKEDLPERITDLVNGERPEFGGRAGPGPGFGSSGVDA